MSVCNRVGIGLIVVAAVLRGSAETTSGQVVRSTEEAAEFPHAPLACKLKLGPITEREVG